MLLNTQKFQDGLLEKPGRCIVFYAYILNEKENGYITFTQQKYMYSMTLVIYSMCILRITTFKPTFYNTIALNLI